MPINQKITDLPTPPSRKDPENFDARADDFLASLDNLADEINQWAEEANTTASAINEDKNIAVDAKDEALTYKDQAKTYRDEAESFASTAVNAPGTDATSVTIMTIAAETKTFTIQPNKNFSPGQWVIIAYASALDSVWMYGVVQSYNPDTGEITVNVKRVAGSGEYSDWRIALTVPPVNLEVPVIAGRRPTPDDDSYGVGTNWIYDDDFFICTKREPNYARWRKRDGELIWRLPKLTVNGPTEVGTGSQSTFTVSPDPDAQEVVWDITGDFTVISGALTGTKNPSITIIWNTEGATNTVRATQLGDNSTVFDSLTSEPLNVTVKQTVYCGYTYCGNAYCGQPIN
jgi:hypothetical protein